jgi:hypothetical protein
MSKEGNKTFFFVSQWNHILNLKSLMPFHDILLKIVGPLTCERQLFFQTFNVKSTCRIKIPLSFNA